MPGGSRAGAGRKATPIDLIQLENLCALQCSDEEIASWFEVSIRTIQNRRAQAKFGEVMRRGQAKARSASAAHKCGWSRLATCP